MEQLSSKRGFVRRAITRAISPIDPLLSDEATPVRVLHQHLELVLAKQAELVEFDRAIQETLTDTDLEADLTTAFEYEQKVSFTKTSVRLATKPRPPILAGPTAQLASPPYPAAPPAAPGECSTSLTSEAKRRKLKARRRCFSCAKRNHVASECRSARNFQCDHCVGQHLTSLCNVSTPSQEQSKRLGNASAPSVQRANEPEYIDTPPRATSESTSGTGLMPTRAVRQSTFIRRDVAQELNCPVQGVERFSLFTFGKTHRPVTLTCNRVSVTLQSQHSTNELTIDALEVPEISAVTSPAVDGAIITMMTHHGLVPADERSEAKTFREDDISILIDSDF
ncbi:hypothetical protein HPB49_016793 [Dermacentor silvarum]|uniref:Uncharacterized protein n=1 Tax=Dermacentor silvarum TaxID=543639 RepID=A0ACB8CYE2_DERSI|nr:hypothetical protein HPB49_016793 [Dermacentor silvarum]